MSKLFPSPPRIVQRPTDLESLLTREWLVTNGLGGYASGTIAGIATRRFHGLLIAALPSPLGRMMMFNHLAEQIRFPDGEVVKLGGEERTDQGPEIGGTRYLTDFRLEAGLPVWRYEIKGTVIEKQLHLLHRQNTVHITYRLISGSQVQVSLRPLLYFRPHEGLVSEPLHEPYALTIIGDRYEIAGSPELPPLRLMLYKEKPTLTIADDLVKNIFYRIEANRGYDAQGVLWSPGYFTAQLSHDRSVTLIASTEPWNIMCALPPDEALAAECERRERLLALPPQAQTDIAAELVLAADQFITMPAGRVEDVARAYATGDQVRTVIAGYHWFTDWGRDTMISLEGLTLATGRHIEARWILRTFAYYIRDGLIPNMFPEGEKHGLYHTADATLWFFHALDRYLAYTHDRETLKLILPKLCNIVDHHLQGTRFGIHIDPQDGLLTQGQEGYQLTWMDAKVGEWVVTPRRGKAVELNALWYNALRLLAGWVCEEQGDDAAAAALIKHAEQAQQSFNARFWNAQEGYLYDVVDGPQGDDPACRPNQVLALSLHYPILEPSRWQSVLDVVRQRLLTPVGLRSLASGHPDYKPNYDGDLRARDAAYHQGTVWAWLIGPFIDAWLKVHPDDRAGARHFLEGFVPHIGEACIGSISEIFDAEPPYAPRGCAAQAWSVAEVLRCWIKTTEEKQEK